QSFLEKLAAVMLENGVKPEVEVMDLGMMNACKWFADKGILAKPVHYQFVLGFGLFGAPATPQNLCAMVDKLPEGSTWSAFGTGSAHLPILYTALALHGNVRVGLEDNIWYQKGVQATNEMLVTRAGRLIKEFGNDVATPDEAREILGLKK
ncbi:MAG: 3-keto-5-aminohexanoate cleavage protein, partial [Oscillospiraceae bacterium]|nr:3-keto-5-aminohexanoate cleavage protein [Oscillospiraceae bacterium]